MRPEFVTPQSEATATARLDPARVGGRTAEADRTALEIRAALDRLSAVLARAAAALVRLRSWQVFGFARLDDHVRERFGRSGRWLRDLAALGEGLAASRPLASALTGSDGGRPLGRVAATLIARAITAPPTTRTDEEWIVAARAQSVRELRAAIRTDRAAAIGETDELPGVSEGPAFIDDDDPDADRCLLRLPVPLPVLAAFDEALDLHRAVEGRSTSVSAFVEALVGEAQSGGSEISPGHMAPLRHGIPEATIEAALRRATNEWAALPEPFAAETFAAEPAAVAEASACLERFAALEAVADRGDAVELDHQIRSLIEIENALEARLGQVLAAMAERRDWQRLRFAGLGHYAEERLGMSRSRAGERARLARALRPLPAVAAACASGRISMEAAALIHRMLGDEPVGADIETAWVEHASAATLKRMRDEARAAGRYRARAWPSGSPVNPAGSVGSPLSPAVPLEDERWFASLHRAPGSAVRRIFEFGFRAAGLSNPCTAPPDVFHPDAAAAPDVFHRDAAAAPEVFHSLVHEPDVFLRLRLPADLAADFLAAIEAARNVTEARAASIPWDSPWPGSAAGSGSAPLAEPPSAWVARIAFVRGRRAPLWVGLLALLEDFALTWDTDGAAPDRRDDTVFVRDGWRCAAPGCSSRRNLEAHHLVYRSRGGPDDGWNLVTLCRFHHQRGEHGGLLSIRGRAPIDLIWRLGRSDVATRYRADKRHSA
ncbi:MAG TPA: DUF222 domain-containing protein [Verrucomicrobiae bacterium]|nr:DUF222 domain-containing protein [Verrucomicrobiae bacterium]